MTEKELACYLKGFFDACSEDALTKSKQNQLITVIDLTDPGLFTRHLKAVINHPKAIKGIVEDFFTHEENKLSYIESITNRMRNIFN